MVISHFSFEFKNEKRCFSDEIQFTGQFVFFLFSFSSSSSSSSSELIKMYSSISSPPPRREKGKERGIEKREKETEKETGKETKETGKVKKIVDSMFA